MAKNVVMPKLGLTMEEGLITEWVKNNGDSVSKGDILFIMETEKITQEVESTDDGILYIVAQAQETVPVGQTVAWLLEPGEDAASVVGVEQPETVDSSAGASEAAAAGAVPLKAEAATTTPGDRIKASPLAKKMAKSYGIDLSLVPGTGPGGRIVAADIEKAHATGITENAATETLAAVDVLEPGQTIVPFTSMRKAVAKNMLASTQQTASTYHHNSVDCTKLQEMRQTLLPIVEKKYGVRITITDLLMKITGIALREHPIMNTRWTDQGILFNSKVNMGMAMALDEGLIVFNFKDINNKSLGQVATERVEFIKKGKTNTFGSDDISGSTFTLSSLGMFGLESFISIINQPEAAIIAVGAIMDKPVVVNGEIVIRPMMNIDLTYDHRIIDGAEAAKFMMTLKEYIENPILAI
jgi:pyruvate dehydrogenase E2 component (dihydrolipoamide acetyltransferase)